MGAPSPLASKGLMPREQRPEHSVAASSTLMGQLWAEPWGGGGGGGESTVYTLEIPVGRDG